MTIINFFPLNLPPSYTWHRVCPLLPSNIKNRIHTNVFMKTNENIAVACLPAM